MPKKTNFIDFLIWSEESWKQDTSCFLMLSDWMSRIRDIFNQLYIKGPTVFQVLL